MTCMLCRKDILEKDKSYYSRQAGMRGNYHWKCFIEACRRANRVGAKEIESIAVNSGLYDQYPSSRDTVSG